MLDLDALLPVIVLATTAFGLLLLMQRFMLFKSGMTHAGNVVAVRAEATGALIAIIYTTARTRSGRTPSARPSRNTMGAQTAVSNIRGDP